MIIGDTIKHTAATFPERIAIHCDGADLSYQDFQQLILTIQQNVLCTLENPIKKRIAMHVQNDATFLATFLAITGIGAIAIPLDPKWSDLEVDHILNDCKPDLIISNGIREFSATYPTAYLEDLIKHSHTTVKGPVVGEDSLFYIGYTSGTTGKPKGYLRTHDSWYESFNGTNQVFNLSSSEVISSPGPLVHSHFLYAAIHALHIGATLHITKKFNERMVYEQLCTSNITTLFLVPTMFQALAEQFEELQQTLSLNRVISAGAKWEPHLKEKAATIMPNADVFEFYGASELSFVSVLDPKANQVKPESVGRPFPGVEVSIKRGDQTEALPNEIGMLYVRSPHLFSGYLNQPEATKEVFSNGWATVGDIGYVDEEGFITLVGRDKNKLITGGLNVYPEEVEQVLSSLEEIHEVIVIGLLDDYWGEKLVAILSWRNGMQLTEEQLKQHCKTHLATYKCPRQFIEVPFFPYTSSGKIARRQVMEQFQQRETQRK
ncbi:AMP-binding protein [Alkalihalophilus lindianensis]|uniref:AMP-binding protein n=1 Tax=Alkalihalophilus lindianensis TaxID=1630542 RepID=A0ABU3X6S8_9BACI|nr:AMP-binding protein [Alkalihalophilus lindianensis]MDV2682968.1 AMP-binding protein [Alkalihalophilus lindianensis]